MAKYIYNCLFLKKKKYYRNKTVYTLHLENFKQKVTASVDHMNVRVDTYHTGNQVPTKNFVVEFFKQKFRQI